MGNNEMNIGDLVISRYGPLYSRNMIVCLIQIQPTIQSYVVHARDIAYLKENSRNSSYNIPLQI